ncbi:hypothetical protein [Neorhizobium sp. S3-V5DH]|uniref:hypothetical protein n=1 Tax=Neorhizobium sp. S3-V5DH TaxID=2485166 RepID=UPI00104DBC90|nr:hypothetical protein [Neorhizobium sp. S3-V5DH]TCV66316.1 hypothetical protein EDE09_11667 [Neorhizobium sp. S3-V5DH]
MHTAAITSHNFDTREMRTLVSFMRRRFLVKNFVDVAFFTESEREEFDRLCAEMDVPSAAEWKILMRSTEDEAPEAEDAMLLEAAE